MSATTLAYLVTYCVFSLYTKQLGRQSDGAVLLLASMLACTIVWVLGLLVWDGWRRWTESNSARRDAAVLAHLRTQNIHITPAVKSPPFSLHQLWQRLFHPDTLQAAAASATILLASTLAYGQPDVSLLLPLLLMKGGPNIWGVLLSWLRGEGVTLRARVVLGLAVTAVVAVLWHKLDFHAQLGVGVALICATVYVLAYYPKLSVMSRYRGDVGFLITEMTGTLMFAVPAAVILVLATAVWRHQPVELILAGHTVAVKSSREVEIIARQSMLDLMLNWKLWLMAVASEGAGLFGGLIFMAKMASALSVSINRCTSLLGGFAATLILWASGRDVSWLRAVWDYITAPQNRPELVGVVAMLLALLIGLGGRERKGGGDVRTAKVVTEPTVMWLPEAVTPR